MTEQIAPRKTPCASCPYRKNVPSGVWEAEEYAKLPAYDAETYAQPLGVFMCHQGEGDICAGWFAYKDPYDLMAVRLALASGNLDPEILGTYRTSVPLFESGAEAAAHGTREIESVGERAQDAIAKIIRKRNLDKS